MDRLSLLVRAKISIHASAKEATSLHMLIHLSYLDFNPRLREGGDALRNSITHQTDLISIHASAKEATFHSLKWRINTTDFNPRLREGGDNGWLYIQTLQRNFNPRLREGGDQNQTRLPRRISIFQSTPPRRRRPQTASCIRVTQAISIHASAKEATI